MKAEHRYPSGACRNADFVTGSSKLKKGEKVVNLQRDTDDLPSGLLCVSESTVRNMAQKLKLEFRTEDELEYIEALETNNHTLMTKVAMYESAIEQMKAALAS